MIDLLKRYLACLELRKLFRTVMQAEPETLMIAMAARPGALDKAKIVGS